MKSNNGRKKAPQPKSVIVFKGIKGLVASGAGTKKSADTAKIRPEGAIKRDSASVLKP